jgi:MoaA/NifB/PqqE/SkfB family radical SAM enzyme
VFSLHFEHEWTRVFDTILKYYDETEREFFVNIMAHHDKMDHVRTVVKKFDEIGIKYAVRRIRWTEGDHNVFDDLRYDGKDLQWILDQESTVKPNTVIYKHDQEPMYFHSNDVIKNHINKFKDWTCRAGLESLMINWDGEVHRATCRVGGSLGNIYNGTFMTPTNPIICTRDWCTCAADIPLTKEKNK